MDIRNAIDAAMRMERDYEELRQKMYAKASDELGATVLSIRGHEVHIYEPAWVASLPGADITERGDDIYPWTITAKDGDVLFFSIMSDKTKEELEL